MNDDDDDDDNEEEVEIVMEQRQLKYYVLYRSNFSSLRYPCNLWQRRHFMDI